MPVCSWCNGKGTVDYEARKCPKCKGTGKRP